MTNWMIQMNIHTLELFYKNLKIMLKQIYLTQNMSQEIRMQLFTMILYEIKQYNNLIIQEDKKILLN